MWIDIVAIVPACVVDTISIYIIYVTAKIVYLSKYVADILRIKCKPLYRNTML